MGIPHLYTFATKRVNCLVDVDIIQEIDNWNRKNADAPIIVIDFQAFVFAIDGDPIESFFRRQCVNTLKQIEQFFNVLQQKGVKFVFFEDGPTQSDKSEVVISRQNKTFEIRFQILDDLYENNLVNEIITNYILGQRGLLEGIRELARKFGEFHTSYYNECDKEVAAYATKVNAMAIITDDSDYLIFKGNWNYWSTKHINFGTLTTKNYIKMDLQRYLELTEDEMPLLATLAGNDIISKDLLDRFHRYLGNPWYKFENISRYIIQNFRKQDNYEPEYIALRVFGNIKKLPEYTELVRKSLDSYNIHMLNENKDNNFMQRIRSLKNDGYIYLLDLPGASAISLFDVRTPQFEKFPALALDLIRRQIGIILQHKNDNTLTRRLYCYQNGRFVYETIRPEYPTISVPNLDDLYNVDKNDELKTIKLRLLTWVLSERLDFNEILNIEKKYFCVCLTLFFMVENQFITVREADIFLHMIETVYEKFSTIKDLVPLERVDPHAFQIVFLYDDVYVRITDAMSNCGLFELIEHNHMDGLYFHYAYNKMGDLPSIEQIDHLRHYRLYDE